MRWKKLRYQKGWCYHMDDSLVKSNTNEKKWCFRSRSLRPKFTESIYKNCNCGLLLYMMVIQRLNYSELTHHFFTRKVTIDKNKKIAGTSYEASIHFFVLTNFRFDWKKMRLEPRTHVIRVDKHLKLLNVQGNLYGKYSMTIFGQRVSITVAR